MLKPFSNITSNIRVQPVQDRAAYELIEQMAKDILPAVYRTHVPANHVSYFLKKYQTADVIEHQVAKENYSYFFLMYDDAIAGFLGLQLLKDKLNLSKIYLLPAFRGKQIGKVALAFTDEFAQAHGKSSIELIVTRSNQSAIAAYQRSGYTILQPILSDFPNGYAIPNYKMRKQL